MPDNLGLFDADLRAESWFDPDLMPLAWFSPYLTSKAVPVPVLSAITPNSIVQGFGDLTVVATGADFDTFSVARWNAQPLDTSYVAPDVLHFTIPGDLVAAPTSALITIETPPPGGGISGSKVFSVVPTPPGAPTPTFIDRSEVVGGGARLV